MSKDVRTPGARLLIRMFEAEAANADDITTTDAPHIQRMRAEARRDAIDWALEQLRTALPAIEDEAVDIEVSETARIQALLDAEPIPVWS